MFLNFGMVLFLSYTLGSESYITDVAYIPLFAGIWIYGFKAQEFMEFDEEQKVLKATFQRRQWILIVRKAAMFGLFMTVSQYCLYKEQSLLHHVKYGIMAGTTWGVFLYYRMKKVLKEIKEKEDVPL